MFLENPTEKNNTMSFSVRPLLIAFFLLILLSPHAQGGELTGCQSHAIETNLRAPMVPNKNIIVCISDGGGFNTYQAAIYYQGTTVVYKTFEVEMGMTNFPIGGGFSPTSMWADFSTHLTGFTDSAAAATAMFSGQKTANGRILFSSDGTTPLISVMQMASDLGMNTGVVTSVPFSHATPAGTTAHNVSRSNYEDIANEMIYSSDLDLIFGCGNPDFDNNGNPASSSAQYVGGTTTWADLKAGLANGFTLIETLSDFEAIRNGTFQDGQFPEKLVGCPQVYTTLQSYRAGSLNAPFYYPFTLGIPSLKTMTEAALQFMAQKSQPFFLMVEGGAVDWSAHANRIDRLIEEQIDFNQTVEAIVDWVEANSSWEETLLIVTADHETGSLWGPDAGTYNPLTDNGAGLVPGYTWNTTSHTNQLVPLFANGPGASNFNSYVTGQDPTAGTFWGFSGQYTDNIHIFSVIKSQLFPSCLGDINNDFSVDVLDGVALVNQEIGDPPLIDAVYLNWGQCQGP